MKRKPEALSFDTLGALALEGLTRARTRPTVHGYVPHEKQINFHQAPEKGRLYIGGNRSGKTVGGIVEDIWWLRGQHPYRTVFKPPIRGRIVTVSYIEGIQKIVIPEITKWLPPSDLINGSWEDSYSKAERTLTLTNGSTVELMSYDQKLEKFAGTSRHFCHFDEEPPKDIFNECRMRLLDTGGLWWMTMTPVEGMTWVYDDLYEPGLVPGSNIAVITIDTEENPYVTKAEIEFALEGLDASERKARKEGKFVQLGGLAFPEFDPNVHVIDPLDEEKLRAILPWTQYASLDHGLNNPTAWLYHAVSPKGSIVTFDEIYDNNKLVNDYVGLLHLRNRDKWRRPPDIYVGDPAIKQRNGQTGDSIQTAYARAGIPVTLGNNDVAIGIDKMARYLRSGKWVITANCSNLIREMMRLRWKVYETAKMRRDNNPRAELHKKDDHAPDSARYFFSMMPDLYIPKTKEPNNLKQAIQDIMGVSRATPVGPYYIDPHVTEVQTQWTGDEYVGEY